MTQIVVTRPCRGLAQLAQQINAEHEAAEDAVLDSLAHTRRAGDLLREAKEQLSHGEWLPWLLASCRLAPRTAQRYMRLAAHWGELQDHRATTATEALRLLTHESDEPPKYDTVSHLTPALAFLSDKALLNGESLELLLGLESDYGDVLTPITFAAVDWSVHNAAANFWYLNEIRPLDQPPLWPYNGPTANADAIFEAIKLFHAAAHERAMPQWQVTAFWFGATMVFLVGAAAVAPGECAAVLAKNLAIWRKFFRSALLSAAIGRNAEKATAMAGGRDGAQADREWFGRVSDVRHAGVLHLVQELESYPALWESAMAGWAEIERSHSRLMPSSYEE